MSYSPEQVEDQAERVGIVSENCTLTRDMLRAYAATLKAAQGGVAEAMVERVSLAIYARAMESGKRLEPTFCDDLATAALSAQPAAQGEAVIDAKYDDVLVPFARLMAQELHANAGKGDRPGWLSMTPAVGMLEIYYHAAKLQKAVKDDNGDGIREYAADVANMAMMLLDLCGGLAVTDTAPPAEPADSKVIGDDSQIKPGERVPEGWALVPREALGYVSDLLAERKYGSAGRSPAHNARVVVDYWLTAAPAAPAEEGDGKEVVLGCKLGCKGYCKAKAHGCASECPNPGAAR